MSERELLVRTLRDVPAQLAGFFDSIPASDLEVVRRPGAWSILEHLNHLADVQPMLLGRLQQFVDEEHPVITPYFPAEDPGRTITRSVTDSLRVHRETRSRQVDLVEAVSDDIWARNAEHPEYTAYSFRILVRHILMHDYWHLYRMEELALTRDAYLTDLD